MSERVYIGVVRHDQLEGSEVEMLDCEAEYLEWFNNYLTVEKYAEHRGMRVEQAREVLNIGRELNHRRSVS